MSKVFQIVDNIVHHQLTNHTLEQAIETFPPDLIFVEAPNYVFEGWGYLQGEFIKPVAPEGFVYDDTTGTFYKEGEPLVTIIPPEELSANYRKLQEENASLRETLDTLLSVTSEVTP